MGGDGHFFHDLIEGVIIWEDSDDIPKNAPISTPLEAQPDSSHHATHDALPEGALDLPHDAPGLAPIDHVEVHHVDETVAVVDHSAHDAAAEA
ncbi:MAG: hypothetical protein ABJD07_14900 [Gemmatimonadaceae bacterium]